MSAVNIEDALDQKPFTPFDLHRDNGKAVHVRHPDFLMFSQSKRTAVVVEGERFHIVDVDPVSSERRRTAAVPIIALRGPRR